MPVPNQFGTATSAIPLSQLDANFNTPITLGNTAIQLGNTVTTLNNMTLANVTISSGNVTITNVAVTTANVSGTANISTLVVVGNATVGGNTTITGNITAANANVTTNLVLSNGTANGVAYLNTNKVLTTGSALTFDGTNLGLGGTNNSYGSQTAMTLSGTNVSRIDFRSNSIFTGTILSYQAVTEGLRLQTEAGYPITFYPAGTEGMRLTSTSLYTASTINVGIGTSSPNGKFEVASAAAGETVGLFLADATNNTVYVGRLSTTPGSGSSFVVRGRQNSAVFTVNSLDNNAKTATTLGVGDATPAASGAGITFPATQSASSDANTLDDYEEGTWTPNQGVGLTVVGAFSSSGTYTKIGRQVTITGTVAGATSVAIAAGGAICTNCPFTGSGNYAGSIFNAQTGASGTQVWQQTGAIYNVATSAAATSHVFTVTYFV